MGDITEFDLEIIALDLFGTLGYTVSPGPKIAPGEPAAERGDYDEVHFCNCISTALVRLNPAIPADALVSRQLCNVG
jgi:type I restriction enzyme R subunit